MNDERSLRALLDKLYEEFSGKYLNTSMLKIPYLLKHYYPNISRKDIEAYAFLSAIYDYQMKVPLLITRFKTLIETMKWKGLEPIDMVEPSNYRLVVKNVIDKHKYFHRFDKYAEALPILLKIFYENELEELIRGWDEYDIALIRAIRNYLGENRDSIISKYGYNAWKAADRILPSRNSASPLKRINLFLRWIVRREYPDLGLWSRLDPSKLYYPLGSEIMRVGGRIVFGRELKPNRREMKSFTRYFRMLNLRDPVKYDFVLSRIQILGMCLDSIEYSHCSICPLNKYCKAYNKVKRLRTHGIGFPLLPGTRPSKEALSKHNMIVKKTIEYLKSINLISGMDCRMDHPIVKDLRPDIFCINNKVVIGEVKTNSKHVQGPHQLKLYAQALLESKSVLKSKLIGVLAYGKIISGTLELVREAILIHRLTDIYREIIILDFAGGISRPKQTYVLEGGHLSV